MRRRERHNTLRQGAAGPLATHFFDRLGYGAKVREHMAPLVWAETVGPQIAAATEVDRVRGGVLYVSTRSAMWMSELSFYKAELLRRLNEKVGASASAPVITDIRFQNRGVKPKNTQAVRPSLHPTADELADVDLSPREQEQIELSLAIIADEGLRERMRRLRLTDARLRTWRLDNNWSPCPTCGELAPPHFPENGMVDCAACRIARYNGRLPPLFSVDEDEGDFDDEEFSIEPDYPD